MNRTTFTPVSSGSKNNARGVPLRSSASAVDRSPPLVPTKVVGLEHQFAMVNIDWPTDLWGDCGSWRSDPRRRRRE